MLAAWSRRADSMPRLDFYRLLRPCAAPCWQNFEILPEGRPAYRDPAQTVVERLREIT